jgi:NAD(P)H dehydrogenase (quinone)
VNRLPKSRSPAGRRRGCLVAVLAFVLGAAMAPFGGALADEKKNDDADTIIVSGASGGLAGEAIQALLRRGVKLEQLVLVSRTPEKLSAYATSGAQVRPGDFSKPETLDAAFKGGAQLLLISTNSADDRVAQHTAAISAARRAGVRRIVYTSFINATAENPAAIARDHRLTEEALSKSGVMYTILRNQLYMDGLIAEAAQAVKTGDLYTNGGRGKWAPVARRDCADAAAMVLTTSGHERKIYDITGPDLLNRQDLAKLVTDVTGKRVRVVEVDDATFIERAIQGGMPETAAKVSASFGLAIRANALNIRTEALQILLGRKPVSVRELLTENKARLSVAPTLR